jgi:predicted N-acetyltransferase YhbS
MKSSNHIVLSIRLEKPQDIELIYELNQSAFGQANEAELYRFSF